MRLLARLLPSLPLAASVPFAATLALLATLPLAAARPALAAPLQTVPASFTPPQPVAASVFEPAPVPNPDLSAPTGPVTAEAAHLSPTLLANPNHQVGLAYPPHSTIQDEQNNRMRPMPMLNLKVPLQ